MVKQNETRRVMITLSDQAITKLDQLVAEKQRELNQNPELAKYNLRINKSNILEAMLSKNRTLKRKDWFFWLIQPSLEIFLSKTLSREEYLRMLIHHDATDHLLSGDVSDLRELTKQMAVIIEQNTKAYLDFVDAVRRLRLPNED